MDSMNKNKIYGNKSNNKEEASMGMKEERQTIFCMYIVKFGNYSIVKCR